MSKSTQKFHQRLNNIAIKHGLMVAIADKPHTIFLYNPDGDDISQDAIDIFLREGFDFNGFRLGGSDSDLELKQKKVAELVYNKNHGIIKSWLSRHWKAVALLVGWAIGILLFFGQFSA